MITKRATNRRCLLLLALLVCLAFKLESNLARGHEAAARQPAHTLTGNIRLHRNFHSRFLSPDRDIIVYLPSDYESQDTTRYPVIYMQDGQNLFDAATSFFPGMERHLDESAEVLISQKAIRPLIIVGIYSTGLDRINEYTPTKSYGRGGEADLYGRMLVEEIKPFIDSNYRTLASPAETGLGGSSLGGLLTMYLGLKYSDTFGMLSSSSPACDWDHDLIVRYLHSLKSKTGQRIWLTVGTGEPERFLDGARLLREALVAKGWKEGVDLGYLEAAGAEHNPADRALLNSQMLEFLFPPSFNDDSTDHLLRHRGTHDVGSAAPTSASK
jgi:predicted alpha/beta superfamily hydrolase